MISGQGPRRKEYIGDAIVDTFAYDFHIDDDSELLVYTGVSNAAIAADPAGSLKTEGTHYTVTGVGEAAGGNVVFVTASIPPVPTDALANVIILGNTPRNQLTQLTEGGPFAAATIEAAFDKMTKLIQELRERVDRGIILPPTSLLDNLVMPIPGALQLFRWNAAGTAWELVSGAGLGLGTEIVWFSETAALTAGLTTLTLTHNLASATAKLVSPVSYGWAMGAHSVDAQDANTFTFRWTNPVPSSGGPFTIRWGATP